MTTFFAPHLAIKLLKPAMEFYHAAFDAKVLRQWNNDDGSVHVAEMAIEGALFHLHEESEHNQQLSPETLKATTNVISLFPQEPDKMWQRAIDAGGRALSPMQDYDYGYRQGTLVDPFGHQWLIQKKI